MRISSISIFVTSVTETYLIFKMKTKNKPINKKGKIDVNSLLSAIDKLSKKRYLKYIECTELELIFLELMYHCKLIQKENVKKLSGGKEIIFGRNSNPGVQHQYYVYEIVDYLKSKGIKFVNKTATGPDIMFTNFKQKWYKTGVIEYETGYSFVHYKKSRLGYMQEKIQKRINMGKLIIVVCSDYSYPIFKKVVEPFKDTKNFYLLRIDEFVPWFDKNYDYVMKLIS